MTRRSLGRLGVALSLGVALGAATLGATGSSASTTTSTTTTTPESPLACAQAQVATWPLARQANATVTVTLNAVNVGAMAPAARAGFGGLLLTGPTAPPKLAGIVATLQREEPSHLTLLVMADEEGGGVERMTNLLASVPWAQTMGKNLSPAQITAEGARVGRSMLAAGLNTDLAPVLDVDGRAQEPGPTNPDGYRSFSGVAQTAGADGVAFAAGLRSAGVVSVVKHFPGLGYATGDTDNGPAATLPWPQLESGGLIPFEDAVKAGVRAVMVANARVPGLSAVPASLSPKVVGVLRGRLGFTGLIVTDSLGAGAISAMGLTPAAASVQALAAGADLVILAGSSSSSAASLALATSASVAIQRAVTSGTLPSSVVTLAAAHVLTMDSSFSCAPLS